MQVYIMRHGEAQHLSDMTMDDAQRPLTKQGQLEATMMGKWLANMQITLDDVFVSPYLRAQQTCSQVIAQLSNEYEKKNNNVKEINPKTIDFITPSGNAKQVHDYLDGIFTETINKKAVLIVSHMPLVSYLVEELTSSANAPLFSTAAIAQIDYDISTMKGELVRLISPLDFC